MQMQPSLKMFAKFRKICTLMLVIALVLELNQVNGSPTELHTAPPATSTMSATRGETSASEAATTTSATLASSNAPATITDDEGALSSHTEESTTKFENRATTMTGKAAQGTKAATNVGSKSRADVTDQGRTGHSSSRDEDKIRIKNSEHYPERDAATRMSIEEAPQATNEQRTVTTMNLWEQGKYGPKIHVLGADASSAKTTPVDNNTATMQNSDLPVEGKQEKGLYRIKLAEIVTDEFSSLSEITESVAAVEDALRIIETQPTPYQVQESVGNNDNSEAIRDFAPGKLNIVDLYPAKVEDFNPIIRDSNAKLIRERTVFTRIEDEADHRQNLLPNEVELRREHATFATKPKTVNRLPSATHQDSISDFTGKLLAEQDGVITEIEQKFRMNEFVTTTTAAFSASNTTTPAPQTSTPTLTETPTWQRAQLSLSVNRQIYSGSGHDFIDRRVKKSFEFPMHRAASDVMSMPHIDFASTNFNTDTSGDPLGGGSGTAGKPAANMATAAHPEFSTTKFYNSKELYNEMLQHNKQKFRAAIDSPLASTTATTTAPSKFATLLKTLKYKNYSNGEIGSRVKITTAAATTAPITRVTLAPATTSAAATLPTASSVSAESRTQLSSAATLKPKKYQKELTRAKIVLKALLPTSNPRMQAATQTTQTTKHNASQSIAATAATAAAGTLPSPSSIPNADRTSSSPTTSATTKTRSAQTPAAATAVPPPTQRRVTNPTKSASKPIARPRVLSRLQEKINSLECEIQNVPQDSHLWRGNETHELLLPIVNPENCKTEQINCPSPNVSWNGEAEIQSGDILIVEINDSLLHTKDDNHTNSAHSTQVYQVTRSGHEHCDVTEGILLDITPLVVDGRKLVTLYDKDLTEGVNLLIVVSELWGAQCVRLRVTTKTDNCGENADCSGKGVCYSNPAMEEYECQCCSGFAGPHCEEIDACTPSPCTNNGICVDLSQGHEGNSYQCLCPYGYTGKNCQYESDPCNSADCMNGGSCVGNSTHFRCDCMPGYAGPLCQHSLNECESSPCVHGICVDQEDGFRCFCQPGFAGELCNFEYNECESNPCQSGGECIDHIGSYECRCTKGYTGNRCQIKVDFCANKPCPEGQRCIDHGNDFSCECPGGRNGPDCNQMPRTQCNVNPCTHGGTCWSSGDSFYCACRPGYTGTMCEDEFVVETVVSSSEFMIDDTSARNFNDKTFGSSVVLKSPIELHNAYFAAGVLAAAIFIVAIVVTICHCKVNQTYRKFSSRSTTFFPILGFGRRPKSQNKLNKHWLSGKGLSSGNPLRSSSSSMSSSRGHLPATNGNQYTTTGSAALHSQQQQQMRQLHERPFQRHLAMNLENDMYYTVDFSENSQHSPLIQ